MPKRTALLTSSSSDFNRAISAAGSVSDPDIKSFPFGLGDKQVGEVSVMVANYRRCHNGQIWKFIKRSVM
jgi:hypothetical protein